MGTELLQPVLGWLGTLFCGPVQMLQRLGQLCNSKRCFCDLGLGRWLLPGVLFFWEAGEGGAADSKDNPLPAPSWDQKRKVDLFAPHQRILWGD